MRNIIKEINNKVNKISEFKDSQYYKYIVENSNFAVLLTNPEGSIKFANPEACKMFGRTKKDMYKIGRNGIVDLNDPRLPIALEKRKRTGRFKGELNLFRKNGIKFPAEVSSVIFRDSNENEMSSMIICDITERKEMEKYLRESEEKYHTIFESTGSATLIIDEDTTISMANNECFHITGYRPEELIGTTWTKYVEQGNVEGLLNFHYLKRDAPDNAPKNYETKIIKKAGDECNVILYNGIIPNTGQGIVSILDITELKRVENALIESEIKFRTLAETTASAIFIFINDKFLYLNSAAIQILGYPEEELITNMNFWDVVHSDFKELVKSRGLKRQLGESVPQRYEFKIITKNGEEKWLNFTDGNIEFENKPAVLGTAFDITERKQTEETLRKREIQLSNALDIAHLGPWEYDVIKDEFTFNDNFYKMLRVTAEQAGGYIMSSSEYFRRFIHPDDFALVGIEMQKAVDNKDPNCSKGMEHRVIYGDGNVGYISVKFLSIKDSSGRSIKSFGVNQDITEQKKAVESLKNSEEKYRNLIETMPEGFYCSSTEGYFIDINPALVKMLGYESKEEIMKVHIPNELYFTYDDRIDAVQYNEDFMKESEIYRLKKKDGTEIWVEDYARYIKDNSGKVLFHEGILRDITESLRVKKSIIDAKEKAEEMNRLKTNFLANMSHEIRTPLSGILGFSSILKEDLKNPEHLHYVSVIEKSGHRLLETLNLILDFSKLEAEKVYVNYSNVVVEDVIDEVLKSLESMAISKNIYLKQEFKEKNLIINIDERFLRQILNNLVNNAIKYTNNGGVTVELVKVEKEVIIKVKDTGIGIARDKYDVIFEEFRQESEGYSRRFEGTGLGLSITKKFVELMKGKIELESEVGIGSTFTVRFPFVDAPETITIKIDNGKPENESLIPLPTENNKSLILLIEDDELSREFTITALKKFYDVEYAVNGPEAIEKVKNKVFNIILMDINLGKGIDGIEVVRKIRKLPEYEKTPIVALTAFALPGDREEFIACGCTHYLSKPYKRIHLLELLKNIYEKINL